MQKVLSKIDRILQSPRSGRAVANIRRLLMGLTVKQLAEFKRGRGIRASGRKKDLVAKIADRLCFTVTAPITMAPTLSGMDRIRGYEGRAGQSWLAMLVGYLVGDCARWSKGQLSCQEVLVALKDGRVNRAYLLGLMTDTQFSRDYGFLSMPELDAVVARISWNVPISSQFVAI